MRYLSETTLKVGANIRFDLASRPSQLVLFVLAPMIVDSIVRVYIPGLPSQLVFLYEATFNFR
jgi:hypothetical protein